MSMATVVACAFSSPCVYASVCGIGTGIGANRYLYPCRYSLRQREPQIGLRHIGWGCASRAVWSADVRGLTCQRGSRSGSRHDCI